MAEELLESIPATPAEGIQAQQGEPDQQSDTGTDNPQQETTEPHEETEEQKRSRFQRRLDRHKAARVEAETRARMLEERLAQLEARNAPQAQKPAQPADDAPKIADFQDIESYTAAVAEYKAQKILERRIAEMTTAQREASQRQQDAALHSAWSERVAKTAAEFPDWEDVAAESEATVTNVMQRAILESDLGPKVAYFLAKNPDEAERISKLSPMRQIAEIGKLEDKVSTLKSVRQPSKAPAPISPVGGRAKASQGLNDELSVEDWLKERQRQIKAR